MKKSFVLTLVLAITGLSAMAQNADIEKSLHQFVAAADASDADALDALLDPHFRIVMNRMFGSTEVMVMDKSSYLEKIRSKEFGGDKRSVDISQILVNGNTASAQLVVKGKMTFSSLIQLVQNDAGSWLIVQDIPVMQ